MCGLLFSLLLSDTPGLLDMAFRVVLSIVDQIVVFVGCSVDRCLLSLLVSFRDPRDHKNMMFDGAP